MTTKGSYLFFLLLSEVWLYSSYVSSTTLLAGHRKPVISKRETSGCKSQPNCNFNSLYRTIDGTCNNIRDPLIGVSGIPFTRILPAQYEDNQGLPRGEGRASSTALPNPRAVSVAMNAAPSRQNNFGITLMVMQWGQFIDHDMFFTPEPEELECCDHGNDPTRTTPECLPIDVSNDPFYRQPSINVKCLKFVRSTPADPSCVSSGKREQVNLLTSFLDASQVYGSTKEEEDSLRTFNSGLLKIGPGEEQFSGACPSICPFTFLPIRTSHEGEPQLFGGDRRVEEQPGLTSMHTLFVRAHNDLASQYALKYRSANDETLFQETRRVIGALIQHITYDEFLPLVVGINLARQFNLLPRSFGSRGYTSGYSPNLSASAPNVFATATFRFGHTLIADTFEISSSNIVELAKSFNNHDLTLTRGTYPSDFLRGMSDDPAEGSDQILVDAVSNLLFAEGPSFSHGSDLYARNILRGRDHGIPPYNDWRERYGLGRLRTLSDLQSVMPREVANAFSQLYKSIDDIDLFPALIAELPASRDGLFGPLLSLMLAERFQILKFGDRFFYESYDQNPHPFTRIQLDDIRATTLASLICAYTNTNSIQPFVMHLPARGGNEKRNCLSILQGTVPDRILADF